MTDTIQLEALKGLVSSKTGILRRVERRPTSADEPPIPILYDGQLSNFDFKNVDAIERASCGKNVTDAAAQIGAIGEAIEHYCAYHPNVQNLKRAAIEDVEGAVSPEEFVLFSEAQYSSPGFKFARWSKESQIGWLPARELPNRTRVWVPASMVYLNYTGDQRQDFLCPPTSSGSAAGRDLDSAVFRGLMECVERDAFMNTWLARLPAAEIDYSKLGGPCSVIRNHYARYGVDVKAYLMPTDLPVNAIMAIGFQREGDGPAAVVGLGCGLEPESALRGALFEVCQVRPAERMKQAQDEASKLNSFGDVNTLEDHAAYFIRADHLHEMNFLTRNGKKILMEDLPDHSRAAVDGDLAFIVAGLTAIGSRAFFADITTPDLIDYPIKVVRCLATGLQPIGFGHSSQRLGGKRLYELPVKLGYASKPLTEADLNPCPHPLA